jgi:heme-degrading monooxygenase HmoA
MSEVSYAHGMWRVKPGKEAEFIEAWKALGNIYRALPNPPGPGQGILIENVADPLQFYSVGPWRSSEDLAAMRANPQAQAGIKRLEDLCDEGVRGTYRLVASAEV